MKLKKSEKKTQVNLDNPWFGLKTEITEEKAN